MKEENICGLLTKNLESVFYVLKVVRNKSCGKILNLLNKEGSLCVSDIYIELKMEQSNVSEYLSRLQSCGLVFSKRDGKNVYYGLIPDRMENIKRAINSL